MRKKKILHLMIISILGLSVVLSGGCVKPATPWPKLSGFLLDYRGMYRSEDIEGMFVLKHPSKDIRKYSGMIIDPITIYISTEAKPLAVNKADLEKAALSIRDDVTAAFGKKYSIVKRPGRGVLRFKAAIAEVLATKKENIVGGVIELEFIDTQTGDRVLAAVRDREGKPLSHWVETLMADPDEAKKKVEIYKF